jgi:hypothetical protein
LREGGRLRRMHAAKLIPLARVNSSACAMKGCEWAS